LTLLKSKDEVLQIAFKCRWRKLDLSDDPAICIPDTRPRD